MEEPYVIDIPDQWGILLNRYVDCCPGTGRNALRFLSEAPGAEAVLICGSRSFRSVCRCVKERPVEMQGLVELWGLPLAENGQAALLRELAVLRRRRDDMSRLRASVLQMLLYAYTADPSHSFYDYRRIQENSLLLERAEIISGTAGIPGQCLEYVNKNTVLFLPEGAFHHEKQAELTARIAEGMGALVIRGSLHSYN